MQFVKCTRKRCPAYNDSGNCTALDCLKRIPKSEQSGVDPRKVHALVGFDLSKDARSFIRVVSAYPFNGSINVYSGEDREQRNKYLYDTALEVVGVGLATIRKIKESDDCYILTLSPNVRVSLKKGATK